MNRRRWAGLLASLVLLGCGSVPVKHYFEMNYVPAVNWQRLSPQPYPCTIRVADLNIEQAYNRPEIVYRQSPFQLQYYFYRIWAVKPARMLTDLIYKHLIMAGLVSNVIRRYDESPRPNFDLSGTVEAVEEYDSGELWFAHLALSVNLVRVADGSSVYTRRFDLRKRVYQHSPEYVVRELSSLMEYIMTQVIHDLDHKFAPEFGGPAVPAPVSDTSRARGGASVGEIR